jgi:AraC-like DNA-binding protein
MSKSRQAVHACPRLPSPVTALAFELSHGHVIPEHAHPEDQLVYAVQGVMTVRTAAGTWVVPAQRAVWIPAGTPHGILISGKVSMRTVYLRARTVWRLPRACCIVNVSPLLQQIILQLCSYEKLSRRSKPQAHLIDVFIDQLETVRAAPLQLPTPSDKRAARVAAALQRDDGHPRSVALACRQAGASRRTIERLFRQETHLSLGKWRQQFRLMRSLELLAAGEKISHAALEAGYSTPSAFIAMFRKALGTTPRRYFAGSASSAPHGREKSITTNR